MQFLVKMQVSKVCSTSYVPSHPLSPLLLNLANFTATGIEREKKKMYFFLEHWSS